MTAPDRPALRWHGGKWLLAPWIIGHLPEHRIYTEVYGGAASVLLRKSRSYGEIYNDLGDDVVNFFRVLQDRMKAERLRELLTLTPYSRREFELSYQPTEDDLERARRLVVRSVYTLNGRMIARKAGPKTRTHAEMLALGAVCEGAFPKHKFRHVQSG